MDAADLLYAIFDNIAPPDYAVTHRFWPSGQGGGIAVVCHRELKLSMLTVISECHAFECLTFKLAVAGHRLNLACFYCPPSSSTFSGCGDDSSNRISIEF